MTIAFCAVKTPLKQPSKLASHLSTPFYTTALHASQVRHLLGEAGPKLHQGHYLHPAASTTQFISYSCHCEKYVSSNCCGSIGLEKLHCSVQLTRGRASRASETCIVDRSIGERVPCKQCANAGQVTPLWGLHCICCISWCVTSTTGTNTPAIAFLASCHPRRWWRLGMGLQAFLSLEQALLPVNDVLMPFAFRKYFITGSA